MDENSHNEPGREKASFATKIRLGIHNLQVAFGETFGLGPGATLATVFAFMVLMTSVF